MNIKTLQNIMNKLFRSGGKPITHGKKVYSIYQDEHCKWIQCLPIEEYKKNSENYDVSPVGWYAFLRIA